MSVYRATRAPPCTDLCCRLTPCRCACSYRMHMVDGRTFLLAARKRKKAAAEKRHYKRVRSMQLPKKLY